MLSHTSTRNVWAAASTLVLDGKRITIRKVMGMTGMSSTSNVAYHLKKLEGLGYITKPPRPKNYMR